MIRVVAAVISDDKNNIYICKRPEGILGGFWEFPGGKVEKGEADTQALKREIKEELGCEIDVIGLLDETVYEYEKFTVNLVCYECIVILGECRSKIHVDECFERIENFDKYIFAPADYSVINIIKEKSSHFTIENKT